MRGKKCHKNRGFWHLAQKVEKRRVVKEEEKHENESRFPSPRGIITSQTDRHKSICFFNNSPSVSRVRIEGSRYQNGQKSILVIPSCLITVSPNSISAGGIRLVFHTQSLAPSQCIAGLLNWSRQLDADDVLAFDPMVKWIGQRQQMAPTTPGLCMRHGYVVISVNSGPAAQFYGFSLTDPKRWHYATEIILMAADIGWKRDIFN